MVEAVTAVTTVTAGYLIIIRPLHWQIRGGVIIKLPLQDPTHPVVRPEQSTFKFIEDINLICTGHGNYLYFQTHKQTCFHGVLSLKNCKL